MLSLRIHHSFLFLIYLPLLTVHLLNLLSFLSTCTNNLYLMSLHLVDTYILHRVNSPTTSSISTLRSWIPLITPMHLTVCPSRYTWRKSQKKKWNVSLLWNHWTLLCLWCVFVSSCSLPSFLGQSDLNFSLSFNLCDQVLYNLNLLSGQSSHLNIQY